MAKTSSCWSCANYARHRAKPTTGNAWIELWAVMTRLSPLKLMGSRIMNSKLFNSQLCRVVPNGRVVNVATWPWRRDARTRAPHRPTGTIWAADVVKVTNKASIPVSSDKKPVKSAAAVHEHRNVYRYMCRSRFHIEVHCQISEFLISHMLWIAGMPRCIPEPSNGDKRATRTRRTRLQRQQHQYEGAELCQTIHRCDTHQ